MKKEKITFKDTYTHLVKALKKPTKLDSTEFIYMENMRVNRKGNIVKMKNKIKELDISGIDKDKKDYVCDWEVLLAMLDKLNELVKEINKLKK